jgi:hypothetical protein
VRPYRVGAADTDSDERTGRSQEETRSTRDEGKPPTRTGGYELGRTAIWRASPQFKDAVSKCLNTGSQSSARGSPSSRGQTSEISPLPRHFWVGSNSVERLDCSTPDGNTTQAHQFSRRTVEDAVHIQPQQGSSLKPDLGTRPGGRNERAGRPTSFYTTP